MWRSDEIERDGSKELVERSCRITNGTSTAPRDRRKSVFSNKAVHSEHRRSGGEQALEDAVDAGSTGSIQLV